MQKEEILDKIAYIQRESFISTINNDLKIPILAQIRALELLIEEKMGSLNNCQKEIINLTLDSCRSMYGMLSEILAAYKFENKNIVLDLENINIVQIVENYFAQKNKIIENKNINILIKNDSFYPIIRADKFQIKKAFEYFANYCLSCASMNSCFVCCIYDSDDYIHLKFTFENPNFLRDKLENILNTMDKVGCGLELYLAKQIVHAHKGSINVDTNTYIINLPLTNVNNVT